MFGKSFFIHLFSDGWQLNFFGNARYCLEEHFIVKENDRRIKGMIRLVCCSCYFNLMFYMKNHSPQVFYNGTSGCLESIDKITNMREKTERTCADFIGIQKDSVVFICFDRVEYQIWLID